MKFRLLTLLVSIACVPLLVGGIVIMNVMLASVPERTHDPIPPQSFVAAFVFSGITGVVFGHVPARRATRLDPIDGLRGE